MFFSKRIFVPTFLLLLSSIVTAQDSIAYDNLFSLSLEDFLNVEIVSASKFKETAGQTPARTLVITQEDIEAYGYSDLNEIIENIPGFYMINDLAFNGAVPGVRGFWSGNSRNIVILVNGIKTMDNYSSGYRLRDNAVPVRAIDRIEVIRGPLSVIYGSGAFFGVINIITNESSRSSVSGTLGSLNTKKLFFRSADNSSETFKYSFNGSVTSSDGMDLNLGDMGTNTIAGVPQTTAGRLENRETYFNFSSEFNGFTFDANYIENPREIYFLYPSASDGYLNRQTGMLLSAGYKKDISEKLSVNGKMIYRKQMLRAEADYFNENYYGKENIETEGAEGELNFLITPNEKVNFTTGITYRVINDIYDPFDHPRFWAIVIFQGSQIPLRV